jgi:hypothetical protein
MNSPNSDRHVARPKCETRQVKYGVQAEYRSHRALDQLPSQDLVVWEPDREPKKDEMHA